MILSSLPLRRRREEPAPAAPQRHGRHARGPARDPFPDVTPGDLLGPGAFLRAAPEPPPASLLTVFPADGPPDSTILSGWPKRAGIRVTGAGQTVGGLWIGSGPDGRTALESSSAEWWDEIIAAAQRVRDELYAAGHAPAAAGEVT